MAVAISDLGDQIADALVSIIAAKTLELMQGFLADLTEEQTKTLFSVLLARENHTGEDSGFSIFPDGDYGPINIASGEVTLRPSTVTTSNLQSARTITASDGSTSGVRMIPVMADGTEVLVNGGVTFDSNLRMVVLSLATWRTLMGLNGAGIIALIDAEIGTNWKTGGGGSAQAPSQWGDADWTLTNPATTGDLLVTLTSAPFDGGDAITDVEYDLDGSGSWVSMSIDATDLATPPETFTISGLTDGVEYDVRIRAVNATGDATASTAKSATPTAPAAYNPLFVDNQANASITWSPSDVGADSYSSTLAITVNCQASTGSTILWDDGGGRHRISRVNQNLTYRFENTAGTPICEFSVRVPAGEAHTVVVTLDDFDTAPVVTCHKDGVAQANTGDPATGIAYSVTPIVGILDWTRTGTGSLCGTGDYHIAEFFMDTQVAHSPTLFHDGEHQDWSDIGSPQIFLGGGMTHTEWNDADANNGGTTTLTNVNTFAAV